jgi:hypothetical protein
MVTECTNQLFEETVSRDFLLLVFYESVSPQPQSIPLGPFRLFSKIRGDIRTRQGAPPESTTPVSTTPAANNWKNIRLLRP